MVGRLVEKKGFEYGLQAFARMAKSHSNVFLTVVGDGPRRRSLEQLSATLGIGDRVTFTGVLASRAVSEQLRRSDVLLAPSVTGHDGNREGSPMTVKEGSASQVVPVSTYHAGIPEIVEDGATGFLVNERDVAEQRRGRAEERGRELPFGEVALLGRPLVLGELVHHGDDRGDVGLGRGADHASGR